MLLSSERLTEALVVLLLSSQILFIIYSLTTFDKTGSDESRATRRRKKYSDLGYYILRNPEYANTISPRKLHKTAQHVISAWYWTPYSHKSILISILHADKVWSKTATMIWEQSTNPAVREAVLQCKNLNDEKKVAYALRRLANPSASVNSSRIGWYTTTDSH